MERPDGWRLEVADEGAGVDAADRDRVFARFGTLAEAEGGGGTGLGLAIARWVSDLHGGTIQFVEPEPPSTGARVRVDLPQAPRQQSPLSSNAQEPDHVEPGPGSRPTRARRPDPDG